MMISFTPHPLLPTDCRLFLVHFLSSHVSTPFVKQLFENKILSSILHQEDVALLTRKILTPHSPKDSPNASASASDASRLAAWPLNNDAPIASNKKGNVSSPARELAIGSLEHRLIMSRSASEIFQLLKSLRNAAAGKMPFSKLHQSWETLQLSSEIYNCLGGGWEP